ncbi:hypothetical protein CKO28_05045 [Rhodovibrio sodomensis]|uniref:Uncharacterized protein n=1 Tax=Rhodovibrio sodomensis TaxID=1088 RepID=A0ABS1DAK3_9PROT|nr:hypothetical protein [Rhodovibrio sodomensis]
MLDGRTVARTLHRQRETYGPWRAAYDLKTRLTRDKPPDPDSLQVVNIPGLPAGLEVRRDWEWPFAAYLLVVRREKIVHGMMVAKMTEDIRQSVLDAVRERVLQPKGAETDRDSELDQSPS